MKETVRASGWIWIVGLVACGSATSKGTRDASLSNQSRDKAKVGDSRPLLIRIPTDPGEGHDPRFTTYGERVRPVFVAWEPGVVACVDSRAPLKGTFDLAVIVDRDGTIVDQSVMNNHLDEPELDRTDEDFYRCVTDLVRAHREKFPPTPDALQLVLRYPFRLPSP